jgi:hypothetical protein
LFNSSQLPQLPALYFTGNAFKRLCIYKLIPIIVVDFQATHFVQILLAKYDTVFKQCGKTVRFIKFSYFICVL